MQEARRRYIKVENARRDQANEVVGEYVWRLVGRRGDSWDDATQEFLRKWIDSGPHPWAVDCDVAVIDSYVRSGVRWNRISLLFRSKRREVDRESGPEDRAADDHSDPIRAGVDAAKPRVVAILVSKAAGQLPGPSQERRYHRSLVELQAIKGGHFEVHALVAAHAGPGENVEFDDEARKTVETRVYQWHGRDLKHLVTYAKSHAEVERLTAFERGCLLQAIGELFQRKFGGVEITKYTSPLTAAERHRFARQRSGGSDVAH